MPGNGQESWHTPRSGAPSAPKDGGSVWVGLGWLGLGVRFSTLAEARVPAILRALSKSPLPPGAFSK